MFIFKIGLVLPQIKMAYFPGKQTATPSKPKSGGGGGGGSSGTPYKTSPALTEQENLERQQANISKGIGDVAGRSPSDPDYGKGVQAPSEQFRSGGGAAITSTKVELDRQKFLQATAYKQEVSKAGRAYYSSASEAVTTSAARRSGVDQQPVEEKRDLFREKGPSAKSSYSYKKENGKLKLYVTPSKQESSKGLNIPEPVRKFGKAAYQGVRVVGYGIGAPFQFAGKVTENIGVSLLKRSEKNYVPKRFEKVVRFQTINVSKGIKYGGEFVEGYGRGFVEKPGTSLAYAGAFAGIGFVLQPVSLGVKAGSNVLKRGLPTSLVTKTGEVISRGGAVALTGLYGYSVYKRAKASPEPVRTVGVIASSELSSAIFGGQVGTQAWLKTQGYVRSLRSKYVPQEQLVPPEVISGKKTFPTAKQSQQLKLFKQGKYAIQKTEYTPTEAKNILVKKGVLTYEEGAFPTSAFKQKSISGMKPKIFVTTEKAGVAKTSLQKELSLRHELLHAEYPRFTEKTVERLTYRELATAKSFSPGDIERIASNLGKNIVVKDFYYPHATPALFGRKFTTQIGERPKEAAGMFISGKGASTYFLRIGMDQPTTYYPKSLLPEAVTPTLVYVRPTQVTGVPKSVRASYGKTPYGVSYQFFMKTAKKGAAYVPGVKSEVEAVIPPESLFKVTTPKLYTQVKGVDVPIKLYNPATKISARQYYYPGEDITARQLGQRVAQYYYPAESYNVPGITYGLLSKSSKKSAASSITTSKISSAVSSKSSYTPPSKVSYSPYSKVSVTKYSYIPSKISRSGYSGGSRSSSTYVPSPIYSGGGGSSISSIVPPTVTAPPPPIPKIDLDFYPKLAKPKGYKKLLRPFKYQASIAGVIRRLKGKSGVAGIKARGIPGG